MLSALANSQQGLILIAGQFGLKFNKISIEKGLQMDDYLKSE